MNRADLIQALREANPDLSMNDMQTIVTAFFDQITDRLAAGGRVELRGFGTFTVREYDARTGRNPRSGELVAIDARRAAYFRPGQDLRKLVIRSKPSEQTDGDSPRLGILSM